MWCRLLPIAKIKHKGFREVFETGSSGKVDGSLRTTALYILDFLDGISSLADCSGVKDFHPLKGKRTGEYSMRVSGNWVVTFTYDSPDVTVLDLEDYH